MTNQLNVKDSESKLVLLRRREANLKAAISAELERERKRAVRQNEQLIRVVGTALLREAEESTPLRGVIRETLDSTVVDESSRRLLSNLGWI